MLVRVGVVGVSNPFVFPSTRDGVPGGEEERICEWCRYWMESSVLDGIGICGLELGKRAESATERDDFEAGALWALGNLANCDYACHRFKEGKR